MRRRTTLPLLVALATAALTAQDVSLEYQIKAAFLYNFVKYVEWPNREPGDILICVAGQNPFGTVLDQLVRNERIRDRALRTEVILEPRADCNVVFTPRTSYVAAYLRAAAGQPVLTVGESPRFIEAGGIINFITEGSSVRFEINRAAADRARLRISSRLLQLARIVDSPSDER